MDAFRQKIAEMICELNCWRTPKEFKKKLTEEEIEKAMDVLQQIVPYSQWIKVWQKQDMVGK